jgi:spore germination protein YaaH
MKSSHSGAKYTCGYLIGRHLAIAAAGLILAVSPSQARPQAAARPARPELWGFAAPWDPRSAATLAQHASALSVVISGWLRLDTVSAMPASAYPDTVAIPHGTRRYVLVTTYARDRFHPEIIRRLAADPALRTRAAAAIALWAYRHRYRGIVLDFEALTPADSSALSTVVRAVAIAAHRRHVRPVTVAVPPADTITYAARRLAAADLLLPMLYDEHWSTGAPGPIASPGWVRQLLAPWVATAGASRLVAGLPIYGYLWKAPAPATVLSFDDARQQAASAGVTLERDSASLTLHFTRADSAQGWVSDAQVLQVLMRGAESAGIRRFALWRLGLEDPAIWLDRPSAPR